MEGASTGKQGGFCRWETVRSKRVGNLERQDS